MLQAVISSVPSDLFRRATYCTLLSVQRCVDSMEKAKKETLEKKTNTDVSEVCAASER